MLFRSDLNPAWIWTIAAAVTALYFASLLLHEFGHAIAAHRLGIPIHGIELHLFGGVVHIRSIPRRPWEELLLALSGPLVSLVLGWLFIDIALLLSLSDSPPMQTMATIANHLAFYNIAALMLNLIPVYPMDGGRALRALLWAATGNFRLSITLVLTLGLVLLGLLGLLGLLLPLPNFYFNASIIMLAIFIGRIMWQSHGRARQLSRYRVEDLLDDHVIISVTDPEPVEGSVTDPEPVEGSITSPEPVEGSVTDPEPVEGSITDPEPVEGSDEHTPPTCIIHCDSSGHPLRLTFNPNFHPDADATLTITADDCTSALATAIDIMPQLQLRTRPWLVALDADGRCRGLISRRNLHSQLAGL